MKNKELFYNLQKFLLYGSIFPVSEECMSVLENFEQRISEAQSNKDCEDIISDICSSAMLHNKDRKDLLEKIISSPKFEKPSKNKTFRKTNGFAKRK